MKDFIVLLLSKLGLGVGASYVSIYNLENNLHNVLGYDFKSITTGTTIFIEYKGNKVTLKYTIENNVVKELEVQ